MTINAPENCGDFDYTISYNKYNKKIFVNPRHISIFHWEDKDCEISLIPDNVTANLKVER